ncbi:pseudouridine synthase [Syntrophomonas erecta subsp. sporosyntropha]
MRIAKFLAQAGLTSRRKAEQLVLEGKVTVNGEVVKDLGRRIYPALDLVLYRGKKVELAKPIYILLYKPAGYVSTVSDPQGRPTVLSLIGDIPGRLYPVGRLDLDTEGVLLLSNDGNFTNLMIHPRHRIIKKYEAWVEGKMASQVIKDLEKGILLDDGWTAPARVRILKYKNNKTLIELKIHEGRKRQVKRMCAAVGHPVMSLKRTAFAFLTLKGLSVGEYRYLTPSEVNSLIKQAKP